MEDNLHEVVKLLLARMESHPEEFSWETGNRWQHTLGMVREYGTPEEISVLDAGLRVIMLQEAHETMMDELCNGDERRRREQEEQEYERDLMRRTQNMLLGHQAAQQQAMGIGTTAPSQPLVIRTDATEAMRIQANGEIKIGDETLSEGLLKQIKKGLGI